MLHRILFSQKRLTTSFSFIYVSNMKKVTSVSGWTFWVSHPFPFDLLLSTMKKIFSALNLVLDKCLSVCMFTWWVRFDDVCFDMNWNIRLHDLDIFCYMSLKLNLYDSTSCRMIEYVQWMIQYTYSWNSNNLNRNGTPYLTEYVLYMEFYFISTQKLLVLQIEFLILFLGIIFPHKSLTLYRG